MDKNILKKFAIESRKLLHEKVEDRLRLYYVDEKFDEEEKDGFFNLVNDKHNLVLSSDEYAQRRKLIDRINKFEKAHVIEEAAFTWFNRFVCLRYMELHKFLPLGKNKESLDIRVLSNRDGMAEPEIIKKSNLTNTSIDIDIDALDKIENINDKYEKVILKVCEKMGECLPQIFDGETDYIALLLPKNLLNADSFLDKLIKDVPEENFSAIEVIGWLYQYYNQSEKDRVMKEKRAYKKSEIPYVTQIFTPDWIVKYMVENSLGRLYIEKTGDESLESEFKYFIKDNIEIDNKGILPQNITFIDPCMGSGHILVYAFEVFMKLYISAGYNKKDIPELILTNNLFGLDIDDRAGQFAIISIMLKAREYDPDIFNKIDFDKLNILSIPESSIVNRQFVNDIKDKSVKETIEYLIDTFENGKEIGSLLIVEERDYDAVTKYFESATPNLQNRFLKEDLKNIIRVAKILSKKYDVVVTNPPYLNNSGMSNKLKEYIANQFIDFKMDIFSVFIIRNIYLANNNSYLGYMTPYVWMFIQSYEELRRYLLNNTSIISLNQLEYSALEEAIVPLCTFVIKKGESNVDGFYVKLSDFRGGMQVQNDKYLEIINNNVKEYIFKRNKEFFEKTPGSAIAYWLSNNMIKCFNDGVSLSPVASPCVGLQTGDNERFVKLWYEVSRIDEEFEASDRQTALNSKKKWFPYNKGGEYRKWYGNNDCVVNWNNDGYEIRNNYKDNGRLASRPQNMEYYFKESITWSKISSGPIAFRYKPNGHIFDVAGTSIFGEHDKLIFLLGLNNSKVIMKILQAISPTLNYEVGQISTLPVIESKDKNTSDEIKDTVNKNIEVSKEDWDSFETSWDFKKHPLV